MGLSETLVLYLVAGVAVAGAVYLSHEGGRGWLQIMAATAFWPLYLPILLSRPNPPLETTATAADHARDEMAKAIAQVDAELDTAFSSLDGWAENVLAREKDRLAELHSALTAQAARIREMDALIAHTDIDSSAAEQPPAEESLLVDRRALSEQALRTNVRRLRDVRRRAYDDLMGTLAWIRELVSMIHLAKFTGAPASRAEELVAQIAAAVEGISAVTWHEAAEEREGGKASVSAA